MKTLGGPLVTVINAAAETFLTKCESPIEAMLCQALYRDLGYRRGLGEFEPQRTAELYEAAGGGASAWVFTQHKIDVYRADLLIVAIPHIGHPELLVVECDGNEFHSTPEQLNYDQRRTAEILRAGYKVIRFTGSEIYRYTDVVLQQIVDHLDAAGREVCQCTGNYPRKLYSAVSSEETE